MDFFPVVNFSAFVDILLNAIQFIILLMFVNELFIVLSLH
jgi:hypothetical protein